MKQILSWFSPTPAAIYGWLFQRLSFITFEPITIIILQIAPDSFGIICVVPCVLWRAGHLIFSADLSFFFFAFNGSMRSHLPPGWAWRQQRGAPAAAPCTYGRRWGRWSAAGTPLAWWAWRPGCGTSCGRYPGCRHRWWCSATGGCRWAGRRSTTAAPAGEGQTHHIASWIACVVFF